MKTWIMILALTLAPVANGGPTNNYYSSSSHKHSSNNGSAWKVLAGIAIGVGITCTVKGCDWFSGPQAPDPDGYTVKPMTGMPQ